MQTGYGVGRVAPHMPARNTNQKITEPAALEKVPTNAHTTDMISIRSAFVAGLALCFSACQTIPSAAGCRVEGPGELMPPAVKQVRLGMAQGELESVLGLADYSPADGVFYFSTGGDCPLEEGGRVAPCGLVAEFRDYSRDGAVMQSLQSCWWGAIGE